MAAKLALKRHFAAIAAVGAHDWVWMNAGEICDALGLQYSPQMWSEARVLLREHDIEYRDKVTLFGVQHRRAYKFPVLKGTKVKTPDAKKPPRVFPAYKGDDAKLVVCGCRLTAAEDRTVTKALAKLSNGARKRGGTPYARSDLFRAAIIDYAARVLKGTSAADLDEDLAIMEAAL